MSTTTPLTSTGAPTAGTQASKTKSLGKDDFLKLFVAQLQHQDPMNPMADGEFMGQMASFSTLEQITNVASANETMASSLGMSQSLGLLGKTVTYVADDKVRHSGVVQKVVTEGGVASLTIGGVEGIAPASIVEVDSASASTPTTQEQPPS
jgi:flagellar basal-body rod modification protein FlgD